MVTVKGTESFLEGSLSYIVVGGVDGGVGMYFGAGFLQPGFLRLPVSGDVERVCSRLSDGTWSKECAV